MALASVGRGRRGPPPGRKRGRGRERKVTARACTLGFTRGGAAGPRTLTGGGGGVRLGRPMAWQVIKRRLGKAGGRKEREARQREWDARYGEGCWAIGYFVDGEFLLQEEALETIYQRSYDEHFSAHPRDLDELVGIAKALRNPHAEATTGVDLQVPAILECLRRRGLALRGGEVVDIGTWKGHASHPLGVRLSPLTVKCALDPRLTLAKFWQREKCLALWADEP